MSSLLISEKRSIDEMVEEDFSFPEYIEPNYPITKSKLFDEDNIKHLLQDTRFNNKQDRKRLTDYNKYRQSGGQMLVQYKLVNGCEEFLMLGRLYPNDGLGLQSFRFDIRNPLTKKNYWDVDIYMENAHYCIAERWCDRYDIPCRKLTQYIHNRQECLNLVSTNRKKAKTEFLKILYSVSIKLYNNIYEEVEGDIKPEGIKFFTTLKSEVQN